MSERQAVFLYTEEQLTAIVTTLSIERLTPYLALSGGDQHLAIRLYEWNTALSESFYGLLQGLEIALRNSMHRALSSGFGREDWYTVCPLEYGQKNAIERAKGKIILDKKLVIPCRIVAELTFGFWVALTGPKYAQAVWDKYLHKAFVKNLGRKTLHKRLDRIRKLRNRVAHHESILSRQLKDDFSIIVETVHWICPITAEWLRVNNSFHSRFSQIPTAIRFGKSGAESTVDTVE